MTTLAPSLGRAGFARRLAFLEPSMALWLVLIAVLIFLIASPMVRLVIPSFQEPETGPVTFANYIEAYSSLRHRRGARSSVEVGGCWGGVVFVLLFPPLPLSRRDRLDPARRSQRRLAQQIVD